MKNRYISEFPRALIIGIVIFCIITFINVLNGASFKFDENLKYTFLYTLLYSVSLHLANTSLFIFLDSVFKEERFSKKRIVVGFVSSFVLSLVVIFLLRILEVVVIKNELFTDFI